MEKSIHHQEQNTHSVLLTAYHYGEGNNSGPIGVPHFHKNYELLLPTTGASRIMIDGKEYRIAPGEAVLIHPFQIHSLCIEAKARLWCSVFSAQLVGGLNAVLEGNKPRSPVFRPSQSAADFFLQKMCDHFNNHREWRELTQVQQMAAKAALYAIGCEYISQTELIPDRKDGKAENLAADVARYVSQNYKNDVSLKNVAKELGYSYQYLSKMFHSLFGIHFKTLLNQYRAERALRMLQETSLPITQVAFESGFQSLRSFNHVCVGIFGQTPTELRRRARGTR